MRSLSKAARAALRHKPFRYAIGTKGSRVVVTERADRSGRIEIRYTDLSRVGRDRRVKRNLNINLRGADGAIRPEVEQRLIQLARSQEQRLRQARTMTVVSLKIDTLTIREGVDLALAADGSGLHLGSSRQARDTERLLRRLATEYLDPNMLLDQLLPTHMQTAMERWLRTFGASCASAKADRTSPNSGGYRSLVVAMSAFEKLLRWLKQNRLLSSGVTATPFEWRKLQARMWESVNGRPYRPSVPRHRAEEVSALFDALVSKQGFDPRMKVAFALGAELRLGQLLLINRSDVDLSPDAHNPFGRIHIPSRGTKPGTTLGLDYDQRTLLGHVFERGYLAAFEVAFQESRIQDYPIFVGGKLRKGVARFRTTPERWGRRAALAAFRALERAAGVENKPGRGWYGVRRAFADATPMAVTDRLVLEQIGAHSTATQDRHYRDRAFPELVARAREVRRVVRARFGVADGK